MPFRVLPNGTIECDTIEEALLVQRASSGGKPEKEPVFSSNGHESEDEAVDNMWADLDDNGKRFLKVLAGRNGEVFVTDELAEAFGVVPKDLQRTTIHVRKMGERYSLEPFKTRKKSIRGKFRTLYWMPKSVIVALKEKLSHVE